MVASLRSARTTLCPLAASPDGSAPGEWATGRLTGPPAELHGRDLPPAMTRRVDVLEPTTPAIVLGSTQRAEGIDGRGVDVVRRRSGGGAVFVAPGDPLWVDVDLPAGDRLWDDDVGASFLWLGEVWAEVLVDLGLPAEVHRGAFQPGPWGATVCFAGRGPGEVFVDGAKVVGLAQRRTRAGARFQCAVPARWDPGALIEALVPPDEQPAARDELAGVARGVDADPEALVQALLAHLDEPNASVR